MYSLILQSKINRLKHTQNLKRFNKNFNYQLHFASLISPDFEHISNFSHVVVSDTTKALPRKIHLKRSYLAFSWFTYLTNQQEHDKKHKKAHIRLSFAVLPSKRSLITLQRAPMAHKTNSKEQFMFKFYFFKFSTSVTTDHRTIPLTSNEALLVFYLIKKTFPFFETNLLFLKYYQLTTAYKGGPIFDFFIYITQTRLSKLKIN